ncbi:hypothetical protein PHMEG_00025544 [Phytophthora megakarya]|uniref:Uncharacterized protein n=1 Tax=Phytophthora megakarya TaxID=4795 RepID=A0A225VBT5_9STRA|nr:hypothetical protein PHMEG_00025544 [Phytophthora megakarya]
MRGFMRIGCPMKIIVKAVCKDDPEGPWKIVHTRNGSSLHNPPPSQDARVHSGHRQRACTATDVPPAASLELLVQAQTSVGITQVLCGQACTRLTRALLSYPKTSPT